MDKNQALHSFRLRNEGAGIKQQICSMIADTALFGDLLWADIVALANHLDCYQVPSKTTIFKEGEDGNYLCLLIKGKIEISKADNNGIQRMIVAIGKGRSFGEMAIIDDEPRSATCVAMLDCELLVLDKDNYRIILKERPALAAIILEKLARLLSQRLRAVNGKFVEHLSYKDGDS